MWRQSSLHHSGIGHWTGHMCCMSDNRFPKSVFYEEFGSGRRKRGGQKLCFKDVLKRHMKNVEINTQTWEEDAMDRKKWQSLVHKSIAAVEQNRLKKYQAAHNRRHAPTTDGLKCNRCSRLCRSHAGLVVLQRSCRT